jgi:hypothetical protein
MGHRVDIRVEGVESSRVEEVKLPLLLLTTVQYFVVPPKKQTPTRTGTVP